MKQQSQPITANGLGSDLMLDTSDYEYGNRYKLTEYDVADLVGADVVADMCDSTVAS